MLFATWSVHARKKAVVHFWRQVAGFICDAFEDLIPEKHFSTSPLESRSVRDAKTPLTADAEMAIVLGADGTDEASRVTPTLSYSVEAHARRFYLVNHSWETRAAFANAETIHCTIDSARAGQKESDFCAVYEPENEIAAWAAPQDLVP